MQLPSFVVDPWIRRKARFESIDLDRFEIRLARSTREYEDAFRLVHLAYAFQGIEPLRRLDLRITEQHVLSEAVVLVAYERDRLVGTISITKDSPAGLPLDKDCGDELAALRRKGARLSEVGSLAIVRRCWHSGLMPLLGMAAARVGFRVHGSSHNVIGVHPKAVDFYRAIWKFGPLGKARQHADLDAPVIGLIHECSAVQAHLSRCFRSSRGLRPLEYTFADKRPVGLDLPEDVAGEDWPRLRMSRDVFRSVFVEQSNRLAELSTGTLQYLRSQRSEDTIGLR